MAGAGRPLRLCLFNPIDPARPVAERELALRLAIAMERLGWQAAIRHHSGGIGETEPDAVLNLFPVAAGKMTAHPWLGCAWGPAALLDGMDAAARRRAEANEISHDAYLVSGPGPRAHLEGLLAAAGRAAPAILPFHVSSPRSAGVSSPRSGGVSSPRSGGAPGLGPDSRLFYVGANWDGQRYPALLRRLAGAGVLALYGTAERWAHLPGAWQGPLPFDGRSVIQAAHHWGMGLCLHLPQHRAGGVPNMRVFELAAAGCVIIADRHPFIEEWFGDHVLYVDTGGGEEAAAAAILEQVAWIRAHPRQARAMAAGAQEIFNRHLCLEALLEPLPGLLDGQRERRPAAPGRRLGVLLPDGDPARRLQLLADQGAEGGNQGLSVTALVPADAGPVKAPPGLGLRVLDGPAGMAGLRAGMAGIDALAILPQGVEWPPGHLARMAAGILDGTLNSNGAVLTAGIWPRPEGGTGFPIDPLEESALAPRPGDPVPAGCEAALALLRAGGFCVRTDRLAGLAEGEDGGDGGEGWLSLALGLPARLAGTPAGLDWQPVPGPRLTGLEGGPAGAAVAAVRLPVWPAIPGRDGQGPRAPRLTALNDLSPDLAAGLPFLWRAADFTGLPDGPLWLYGAGRGGELVLDALPATARARLRGFLDSSRQGTAHGLPLLRPRDLDPAGMAAATIIIAAQYVSDILRTLRAQPVAPAHILNAYPYIAERLDG